MNCKRFNDVKQAIINSGNMYIPHFRLEEFIYDFKVENFLIDVAITALCNTSFVPLGKPVDKNYFAKRKEVANYYSYNYLVIYDWEDINKVLNILPKERNIIRASDCGIVDLDKLDADNFLNKYHIQGACRNSKYNLSLVHNGIIVSVMTFGVPRYNKNYDFELLRLCTNSDYKVYGAASKLFNRFLEISGAKSIISYCDNSKFSGKVYETLGFDHVKTGISKHWIRINPFTHYTDNFIRQHGADALLGTNFGKGTSNEAILSSLGFLPVYDVGQSTYVYNIV